MKSSDWLYTHVHRLVLKDGKTFYFFAPNYYSIRLADLYREFNLLYKQFETTFFLDWIAHNSEFILLDIDAAPSFHPKDELNLATI